MNKNFRGVAIAVITCSFLSFYPCISFSQRKIVVLGSSTAAGNGASSYTNAWVGKYAAYIQTLNPGNTLINLAVGGFGTSSVMPTGTGVGEDPAHNIAAALSYNPNIIIVNLPSNDAAGGVPLSTTMARFRQLKQIANTAGATFWITTTQPRNLGIGGQNVLIATRDSIYAQFGSFAIDFWTTIANPDGSINATYGAGDGIHVNDLAHDIFFQRVKAQPILTVTLPVFFKTLKATSIASGWELAWEVVGSTEKFVQEVQRSGDGVSFVNAGTLPASTNGSFVFTDTHPFTGVNYYRIKAISPTGLKYSNILRISDADKIAGLSVFPNPITDHIIHLQVKQATDETEVLTIYNTGGKAVFRQLVELKKGVSSQSLQLPPSLSKGVYFLQLVTKAQSINQCIVIQ